jgi:hypothetical protein
VQAGRRGVEGALVDRGSQSGELIKIRHMSDANAT